jgi:hypothetical protein
MQEHKHIGKNVAAGRYAAAVSRRDSREKMPSLRAVDALSPAGNAPATTGFSLSPAGNAPATTADKQSIVYFNHHIFNY